MQRPDIAPALADALAARSDGIHRPLIAAGPNAGQPRPMNEIWVNRLTAVTAAVLALKRSGYSVEHISLIGALPTVVIESCNKCQQLIDSGEAFDYGTGIEGGMRWRKWQVHLLGVRVVWLERGY